ncbi:hypothetical protein D3C72_2390750 [compost metagenome]
MHDSMLIATAIAGSRILIVVSGCGRQTEVSEDDAYDPEHSCRFVYIAKQQSKDRI